MQIQSWVLTGVVSILGVIIAWRGLSDSRRSREETTVEKGTASMTTVIVKLENISGSLAEIKADLNNMKTDVKDLTARVIVVEQSTKQAHKRIDEITNNNHGG